MVGSGPMFRQMTVAGAEATVWFDSVGGGLEARGGGLTGFAIAGDDQKFYPATGKIVGQTVVLSSPDVKMPTAVRYGWADNPAVNLYNREGLPAVPFRTDRWNQANSMAILSRVE